ncbi:MAG: GTP 3',8-cyclase MoaA [Oligoflexia bacterium]|nr:GTP 3',8-cyclase MoaA [Oligoflexia bacterium]
MHPQSTQLTDPQGRRFHYLRLSITDACNFRCSYCLPEGYLKRADAPEPLSHPEIANLIAGFAEAGFWKVRLTGGEPTVRRDLLQIIETAARTPGVREVALTTNGSRLRSLAGDFRRAGLTSLNVSVDSLDPERFTEISGQPRLAEVLEGIDAAFEAGIPSIKVNAVLLKGLNELELDRFIAWTRDTPISIRFIELMRTNRNAEYFETYSLSAGEIQLRLARAGWVARPKTEGDGPAIEYTRPGHLGRIGVIAPYSRDFCASCNRLRVSSQGGLRLCLFGEKDFSLRSLLRSPEQKDELLATLQELIGRKPDSHLLHQGIYGSTRNLADIGG